MTLEQKVIAKSLGGSSADSLKSQKKKEYKQAQKYKAKEEALALKRQEERERKRQEEQVKPWEQSKEKMHQIALRLQQQQQQQTPKLVCNSSTTTSTDDDDEEEALKRRTVQCRQMQVDELVSLEAMYDGTDELLIVEATKWQKLQELIEAWQENEEDESAVQSVVNASPISFLLQLTIVQEDKSDMEAHVLIQVTFPPLYLSHDEDHHNDNDDYNLPRLPQFDIAFFMVTDKTMVCSADKPLETLAHLDEMGLQKALQAEALAMVPDPCIYLVAVTWLTENLWDYVDYKE